MARGCNGSARAGRPGGQASRSTATGPYGEGAATGAHEPGGPAAKQRARPQRDLMARAATGAHDGARQGLGASTGRMRSSVAPFVILQVAGTEGDSFRDTMGQTCETLTTAERGNDGGGRSAKYRNRLRARGVRRRLFFWRGEKRRKTLVTLRRTEHQKRPLPPSLRPREYRGESFC